jgi:hypothetical protein
MAQFYHRKGEPNRLKQIKIMKQFLIICSFAVAMASCKQQTKSTTITTDTTGLAAYQLQRAADSIALVNKVADSINRANQAAAASQSSKSSARSTRSSSSGSTGSTTMNSESSNAAQEKKGWSKTAKGAVIGGVVGAGAGAVINKKNRAAGAVVGGVVGAGAGAVIGHQKDKKDGRH